MKIIMQRMPIGLTEVKVMCGMVKRRGGCKPPIQKLVERTLALTWTSWEMKAVLKDFREYTKYSILVNVIQKILTTYYSFFYVFSNGIV